MELCMVQNNQWGLSDWIVDDQDDATIMETLSFDFRFLDDDDDDGHDAIQSSGATTNTDRSDDDETTVMPHSPTCACRQASPFSITSSLSLPYSHTLSDYRWEQQTNRSTSVPWTVSNDHVVDIGSNQLLECHITNDVDAWCIEAATRIMISAEVHGKLLMRLRDWNNPHCRRRRDKRGPVPPGWITYSQMIQHVPKLRRIVMKTLERYNKSTPAVKSLPNTSITPRHIKHVLQNVKGVRTIPCQYSDKFYYSLDRVWWASFTKNPAWGYHPSGSSNIVLLLVEQRLWHLLDQVENRGRCYTNELMRRYEIAFHEPLLFKPLGYNSLQEMIYHLPSLQRVQDKSTATCGRHQIQWYIERATMGER